MSGAEAADGSSLYKKTEKMTSFVWYNKTNQVTYCIASTRNAKKFWTMLKFPGQPYS
jgi:hypothetical protein